MRKFFVFIIVCVFIFNLIFWPGRISYAETIKIPDKIRVAVTDDVGELDLSIRGAYRITTVETGELLKQGKTFFNLKFKPAEYGIEAGEDYFKIHAIQITPGAEPSIYLGKRLYRGSLQIIKTKEGLLRAVNIVGLKDYLKGVLYHEVSHRWPIETIKAQAIVSRTFALYQAQENKDKYYYLKSDVSSQVYGGAYAEKYRTNKAVEETEGEVLIYKGRFLPAFFHASCGGRTEDASKLWKVRSQPLEGVICPFCKNSPHYLWKNNLKLSEITKKLKETGYKLTDIVDIEINGRDASNRVSGLILKSERASINISAKDFRQILGPGIIKSTNFKVSVKDGSAYFEGKGWGHGVGMCQWGAFAMAKKGMSAEGILKYYYPGAKVVKLNTR